MVTSEGGSAGDAALRAEHDELARRLGTLRSVDEIRSAAYRGFAAALALGLTGKFSWDRWGWSKLPRPPPRGRYPLLPVLAFLLFAVLLTLTIRAVQRARALRAEERGKVRRFEELRRTLGLDR